MSQTTGITYPPSPYRSGTILPQVIRNQLDKSVDSLYKIWKTNYIKNVPGTNQSYVLFVEPKHPGQICTSEGQGYGMLILALMGKRDTGARAIFDRLVAFRDAHESNDSSRLMAWKELKRASKIKNKDKTAATDGDMDIAYSLLLAAKLWPDKDSLYFKKAELMIALIMKYEINHETWTISVDDCESHTRANSAKFIKEDLSGKYFDTRSSDFMPASLREFAHFNAHWNDVLKAEYRLFDTVQKRNSGGTGLVPDFIRHLNDSVPTPADSNFMESDDDGKYFNNACRVPWRIGVDNLRDDKNPSGPFLTRINTFIRNAADEDPAKIYAGYFLTGPSLNQNNENFYSAPFAVSAMIDTANQKWLNDLWAFLKIPHQFMQRKKDLDYFGDNIRMIDAIIISGNYWPAYRNVE